jgi:hypothetical protein
MKRARRTKALSGRPSEADIGTRVACAEGTGRKTLMPVGTRNIELSPGQTMTTKRKFRGSGFKHTLSAVYPFTGVWIFMLVITAPIISLGMMAGGLVPESQFGEVWF